MPYAVPMIRALSLMPALRWLKSRDIDPEPFLHPLGLSSAPFGHPFRPVSLLRVGSLLRSIAREQGPDVPCRIVEEASSAELGVLGSVALGTRTPVEAVARISTVLPMFCSHEQLSIRVAQPFIGFWHSYTVRFDPETEHLMLQYALAMMDRLLGMTGAVGSRMARIDLPPHPDFGLSHLESRFGDALRPADGRGTHILVDPTIAERRFPKAARDRLLAGRLPALEPISGDGSFSGSVRIILASLLNDGVPTVRDLAGICGTSVRSFQRQLSHEGAAYSDLLQEMRQSHALRLLSNPHATAKSVSADLGYENQSSLTRAVLRWTGVSPKKLIPRGGKRG